MKKATTRLLQGLIVLIAIATLAFMLWEPQVEGVNAYASNFEIYFKDPLLAYAYLASIPFFVGLFQIFKVLGFVGKNNMYSQVALKALQTLRYCALLLIGLLWLGVIFIFMSPTDDRPPIIMAGVFFTLLFAGTATVAAKLHKRLQDK